MKRILFVDDEPRILDGLRRLLRPMRAEWDVQFAAGGLEALQLLAAGPIDVVVSDMRMPQMDGAELLGQVRQRFPRVVRLLLTGQCDQRENLRAVRVAHRQMSKPADADVLKATVQRACALHEFLNGDAVLTTVSQLESVPSLPSLYLALRKEVESVDPSVKRVGEIVGQDPAMSAKVLQIINSSFFGLPRRVNNPAQAVMLLGLETIQALVLAAEVFQSFEHADVAGFQLDALWGHCQEMGVLAQAIAQVEHAEPAVVEWAALGGLMHDLGQLILAAYFPDKYRAVLALHHEGRLPLERAERQVLGADHAAVGAYLLGLWGLPEAVVEAVAWHHEPGRCPASDFQPLTAVHIAGALTDAAEAGAPALDSLLDRGYLERLGCLERLPDWRATAQRLGIGGVAP